MFFTYLRRELRRRMRQAIFISLGLAVGIGLVITVVAASDGVKNSQAAVLHALYGVGTDLTVTQPPKQGSGGSTTFGFRQQIRAVRSGQIAAGTKINVNDLVSSGHGTLSASSVPTVARQHDVAAAVGGLTLTDVTVTGTVPSISAGQSSFSSNFSTNSFAVEGVDLASTSLGSLSSARLTAGTALTSADANSDDAVIDSGYATQNKLAAGSAISVGGRNFKVIGIVSVPQGGSPPDVYIPLAKAQRIAMTGSASLAGQVNTIYVSAASAADIPAVQSEISKALPSATVTDLQRPGQRGDRVAGQRIQPGQQPRQMAVSRRAHRGVPAGQPPDDGGGGPAGARVRHTQGAGLADPADRRPGDGRVPCHRRRRRGSRGGTRIRRRRADRQAGAAAIGDRRTGQRRVGVRRRARGPAASSDH